MVKLTLEMLERYILGALSVVLFFPIENNGVLKLDLVSRQERKTRAQEGKDRTTSLLQRHFKYASYISYVQRAVLIRHQLRVRSAQRSGPWWFSQKESSEAETASNTISQPHFTSPVFSFGFKIKLTAWKVRIAKVSGIQL